MPLTRPELRKRRIPSTVCGGVVRSWSALNCRPWSRSCAQAPLQIRGGASCLVGPLLLALRLLSRLVQLPLQVGGQGQQLAPVPEPHPAVQQLHFQLELVNPIPPLPVRLHRLVFLPVMAV